MIRLLPVLPWPYHASPIKPWPYLKAVAALLLFCSPLAASELVVTTPIEMRPYVTPGVLQPITVDGFDPVLGTLTAVRVDLEMHEQGAARGENEAPGPAQLFWQSRAGLRLASVSNDTLFAQSFRRQIVFRRCSAYDGSLDFAGTSGFTQPFKTQATIFSAYFSGDPAELQRFVGAGPRPFLVERIGANLWTADSGAATGWLTHRVGGRILVTYTYEPAP